MTADDPPAEGDSPPKPPVPRPPPSGGALPPRNTAPPPIVSGPPDPQPAAGQPGTSAGDVLNLGGGAGDDSGGEPTTLDLAGLGPSVNEIPHAAAALRVFYIVGYLTLLSILMVFSLFALNLHGAEEFASAVLGPLLAILAGASGYYFGSRTS